MLNSTAALNVYQRLYAAFGPQHWWPARTRMETVAGAILVQHTAWKNAERAIERLRLHRALTAQSLCTIPLSRLASLLRPAGSFRQKARRLRHAMAWLTRLYGHRLQSMQATHPDALHATLLQTKGIGPETAGCILLYAAGRPAIIVDTYTRRVAARLGWTTDTDARADVQALPDRLANVLPMDPTMLGEFHALLVELGKRICKLRPRCRICPLADLCPSACGKQGNVVATQLN